MELHYTLPVFSIRLLQSRSAPVVLVDSCEFGHFDYGRNIPAFAAAFVLRNAIIEVVSGPYQGGC